MKSGRSFRRPAAKSRSLSTERSAWLIQANVFRPKPGEGAARTGDSARRRAGYPTRCWWMDGCEPLGDARYLLSPGDLFALEQIPEILEIGVAALKIEGRYKDANYVALTTRAYRKAVDEAWAGRNAAITPSQKLATGAGVFARPGSVFYDRDQSSAGGQWPGAAPPGRLYGAGGTIGGQSRGHRSRCRSCASRRSSQVTVWCSMPPIGGVRKSQRKAAGYTRFCRDSNGLLELRFRK